MQITFLVNIDKCVSQKYAVKEFERCLLSSVFVSKLVQKNVILFSYMTGQERENVS